MATFAHHVYFIQNIINRGTPSDDNRLSNRLVAHALKSARSRLIKQKLDKTQFISDFSYQKICVPLVVDVYHDCECLGQEVGCKILRSKYKLPNYFTHKQGDTFQALKLNGHQIPKISITSNQYANYSLASKNKLGYFLENNYVYIINNTVLSTISAKAIWEDPDQVSEYSESLCPEIQNCKDYLTEEFPIDAELTLSMYQLALEILGITYKFPDDNRNDGRSPEQVQSSDPNESIRKS
jgi:hypothetical protein